MPCSCELCLCLHLNPSPGGKRLAPSLRFTGGAVGASCFRAGRAAALMIDWIYFTLPPGTLDNCPFLLFKQTVEATGEVGKWKEAHWGAFTIWVHNYSKRIEVRGSLHKYWSKSHNGGPFPRWAVAQAVQRLSAALLFNPEQAVLHVVEFGANVPLSVPAKPLLSRMMLHSRKGGPANVPGSSHSRRGLMREVETEHYYLKGYDKEAQVDDSSNDTTGSECLRFELKTRKMQLLNRIGVRTLADLTKLANLEAMGKLLVEQWESLLFVAPINLPATVPATSRRLLEQAARVGYWDGFKGPRLSVQVRRYRKAFATVAGEDEELNAATQGLRSVWQQLLNAPAPALSVATVGELPSTQIYPLCKGDFFESTEREAAAPSLVNDAGAGGLPASSPCLSADDDDDEREPTTAARCCLTCNAPLASHRKPETKYCGKKCRNAASNPVHNTRRTVHRILSQQVLFDQTPYLRIPEPIRAAVLAAA